MKNLSTYPGGVFFDPFSQLKNIRMMVLCTRYLIWRLKKMGFEQTEYKFKFRHPSMVYACISPTLHDPFVYCYSQYYEWITETRIYLNSKDAAREVVKWAENEIEALKDK